MPYQEVDATALGVFLRNSGEVAVLDLRPAQEFGNGAPLNGAHVSATELSSRVRELVPHRHTPVVLLDADGKLIAKAAAELLELGYTDVRGLAGGLNGNERLLVAPIRIAGPRVISGEVEKEASARRSQPPLNSPRSSVTAPR
ncbi:rhodanese-like domain-containing protein [Caballeronia sp. 15711]|uniref:rhodanese-like domain-containing protein n=1 Tax=Caballeronia sp. 15711 TaxID=3391029 RepID=UPI0039E42E6A